MLLDESGLTLTINPRVYPMEAVMSAAFAFLDRAYVLLDKAKDGTIVRLWPKNGDDARVTEGDFYAELLNEALRVRVAKQNQQVREMVINRALFAATNTNVEEEVLDQALDSLDDLDDLDLDLDSDNLDFLDDPLGIAVPWEEKYSGDDKKKASDPASGDAAGEVKQEDKDGK
jgi:His-Xaa-Ser system protein HxsD